MDEPCAAMLYGLRYQAGGFMVTVISRTEPTAMGTSATASAKPGRVDAYPVSPRLSARRCESFPDRHSAPCASERRIDQANGNCGRSDAMLPGHPRPTPRSDPPGVCAVVPCCRQANHRCQNCTALRRILFLHYTYCHRRRSIHAASGLRRRIMFQGQVAANARGSCTWRVSRYFSGLNSQGLTH
jgi:hypothetical protein